jgi:hemolysin III
MTFPRYHRAEIAADAIVHALGVGFALIGGPILIGLVAAEGDIWPVVAISVYVATLIAMFTASASYNLIPIESWKGWLRRLDHSTIYLKIAGAYTPFAAISIGGFVGKTLLATVWIVALTGLALKLLYPRRFEILSIILYLALGWASVFVAGDVMKSLDSVALTLIVIAGGLYSLGIVFHLWEKLPFQNAIWHLMVLSATAVLYAAMAVEFV